MTFLEAPGKSPELAAARAPRFLPFGASRHHASALATCDSASCRCWNGDKDAEEAAAQTGVSGPSALRGLWDESEGADWTKMSAKRRRMRARYLQCHGLNQSPAQRQNVHHPAVRSQ